MVTGRKQIGDDTYYFETMSADGKLLESPEKGLGVMVKSSFKVDDNHKVEYYFNAEGKVDRTLTGKWDGTNNKYVFRDQSNNIVNGWRILGQEQYYFNNGVMANIKYINYMFCDLNNNFLNGWLVLGQERYYFNNGVMHPIRGIWNNSIGNYTYINNNTFANGWYIMRQEEYYYFDGSSGTMITDEWREINDGFLAYVDSDGKMINGLYGKPENGNYRYYYNNNLLNGLLQLGRRIFRFEDGIITQTFIQQAN